MRKRIGTVLILLALLTLLPAAAEGLLPSISEIVGVEMPSLRDTLGRWPDAIEALPDGGSAETWLGVTEEQYTKFGNALGKAGCEMADYRTEGTAFIAEIAKEGKTFTFRWDAGDGTAVLTYPAGTVDGAVRAAEDQYQTALAHMAAGEDEPISMKRLLRAAVNEMKKNEIVVVRETLREYADLLDEDA